MSAVARPLTLDAVGEGDRLRHQNFVALALAGVVPLLVLTYVADQYVLPRLHVFDGGDALALQSLLAFTALAMIVGGYTIWRTGRMVGRVGRMMATARFALEVASTGDRVDAITDSLGAMLGKMEAQANEILTLASRLDTVNRELEQKNAELSTLSFRDGLTGLHNRRYFSLRMDEELARSRRVHGPVAVVLLDLDGFKAVNDTLGHDAGDATLRAFAERLTRCSREADVVARLGGDEFAILLPATDETGASLCAERIRAAVCEDPSLRARGITASFGVAASWGYEGASAADLYRAADELLYVAKQTGKNRVAAGGTPCDGLAVSA